MLACCGKAQLAKLNPNKKGGRGWGLYLVAIEARRGSILKKQHHYKGENNK